MSEPESSANAERSGSELWNMSWLAEIVVNLVALDPLL